MTRHARAAVHLTPRLALMGGIMAIGSLSVDMYLPAFPQIARDFHATSAEVSNTLAVFLLGTGIGQVIAGPIVDRYGRRRPLITALVAYALTCLLCAVATNIGLFTLARGLSAFAVCMTSVAIRAMVRDLYDPIDASRVTSTMMLISGLAPVLAPLGGSLILQVAPWRTIFWLLVGAGLLFMLAAWRLLRDTQAREHRASLAPTAIVRDYFGLLRSRELLLPSLASGLSFAGLFAYIAGTPEVLISGRGLPQTAYAAIFGMNALAMVVMSQFNKRWVVRHHPGKVLRRALRVQAISAAVAVTVACFVPLPLPLLCLALMLYVAPISLVGGNAAVLALAKHGHQAGKAAALSGLLSMGLGSVGAALVGMFHDGTERPVLLLMAGMAFLATVLMRLMRRAADGEPADEN